MGRASWCSWPVFAHLAGAAARWAFDHHLLRSHRAGQVVEGNWLFSGPSAIGAGDRLGSSFIDFLCSVVETLADFAASACREMEQVKEAEITKRASGVPFYRCWSCAYAPSSRRSFH